MWTEVTRDTHMLWPIDEPHTRHGDTGHDHGRDNGRCVAASLVYQFPARAWCISPDEAQKNPLPVPEQAGEPKPR
jgi:hypothetical protein